MRLFTRRDFCQQWFASAALAAVLPAAKDEPSAALLYGQGVRMIKEGRTYEKAAAHFARACDMERGNAAHQIALGCAYASRAASLAWAAAFGEQLPLEMAAYQEVVAWLVQKEAETRQKFKDGKATEDDIKKMEEGLAAYKENLKPPTVQTISIKDDKAPYKLSRPELAAQLTELNQKALAAWEKAVTLSQTPDEKANALYVRGWGMRVLQTYLSDESHWRFYLTSDATRPSQFRYYRAKPVPLAFQGVPTNVQIKAVLDEAVLLAPQNALYRQAQADFLAFNETGNPDEKTTELYRTAAALNPKSANLWNRIYDRETAYRYGEKQSIAPLALADLHNAQARDKSNAYYGYEEAGRVLTSALWNASDLLKSEASEKERNAARDAPRTDAGYTAGKRAAALIERANALGRFAPPLYQDSVPVLLARAWGYVPYYWKTQSVSSMTRFQDMGRVVRFYAYALASDKKNVPEALRVLYSLQKAGLRIMGNPWPVPDLVDEKNNARMIWFITGWLVAGIANMGLRGLMETQKNPDALAAFVRENDSWEARVKKFLDPFLGINGQIYEPSVYAVYERN